MEDSQIVALYFARSEQAILETSAKYGDYCYRIAFRILDNREDAQESVNDTYAGAWSSIPPHRPAVLATFLGKIARRVSIDKCRARSAEKRGGGAYPLALEELSECLPAGEDTEAAFDKKRLAQVVNAFVAALPRTEREVFLYRYWYLESGKALQKRFGFSESKLKSMLHRTREKLRKVLEKEGFS